MSLLDWINVDSLVYKMFYDAILFKLNQYGSYSIINTWLIGLFIWLWITFEVSA